MPSQQHDHEDNFIALNVRASVLKMMLSGENLHMSDIHCTCSQSKQALQRLLLQAVSTSK